MLTAQPVRHQQSRGMACQFVGFDLASPGHQGYDLLCYLCLMWLLIVIRCISQRRAHPCCPATELGTCPIPKGSSMTVEPARHLRRIAPAVLVGVTAVATVATLVIFGDRSKSATATVDLATAGNFSALAA